MFQTLKTLPLVAMLALGGAALAQETAAPESTEAAADETGVAPGETYFQEDFGDWKLRCLNNPDGDDPCQLYQLLVDSEGNNVAEVSFFPLPEGGEAAAGATIVAPLETLLTAGVSIGIDAAEPKRYVFSFCNRGGCVARVGFTAAEVESMKNGSAAKLVVVPVGAADKPVELTMSLKGFTAGLAAADLPPAPAN